MKIIPLVLILGATPLAPLMAQGTAAKPKATPAAKPEATQAEEEKPKARRYERVSRRPARAARPITPVAASEPAEAKADPKKKEAAAEKPATKPAEKPKASEKKAASRKTKEQPAAAAKPAATPEPRQARRAARQTSRTVAKPTPSPAVVETADAEPKKKGGPFSFLGKLFGGGKDKAEAEEAEESEALVGPPSPTPAPANRGGRSGQSQASRHQITAATEEVDYEASLPSYQQQRQASPPVSVHRTVSNAQGEVVPVDLNDDLPTAAPQRVVQIPHSSSGANAPVYLEPASTSRPAALPPAPVPEAAAPVSVAPRATFDRNRYQEVRKKASEDTAIAELGEKLNATAPGDAAHSGAARAYTAALFGKMRELDPEQTDWINRMENATLRRIDSGKPVFAE